MQSGACYICPTWCGTSDVRKTVGNKRVTTLNVDSIHIGNHGGKDILIVNEDGARAEGRKGSAEDVRKCLGFNI